MDCILEARFETFIGSSSPGCMPFRSTIGGIPSLRALQGRQKLVSGGGVGGWGLWTILILLILASLTHELPLMWAIGPQTSLMCRSLMLFVRRESHTVCTRMVRNVFSGRREPTPMNTGRLFSIGFRVCCQRTSHRSTTIVITKEKNCQWSSLSLTPPPPLCCPKYARSCQLKL